MQLLYQVCPTEHRNRYYLDYKNQMLQFFPRKIVIFDKLSAKNAVCDIDGFEIKLYMQINVFFVCIRFEERKRELFSALNFFFLMVTKKIAFINSSLNFISILLYWFSNHLYFNFSFTLSENKLFSPLNKLKVGLVLKELMESVDLNAFKAHLQTPTKSLHLHCQK